MTSNNSIYKTKFRNDTLHALTVIMFYVFLYVAFFSPIIFSGKLLAPGDGMVFYLPNFYSIKTLWEPLLWSGFPVAADPQAMTWYPLAGIFSLFGFWNVFVISAYVLTSSFTYGYVFTLTQSRLAGLVGGIVYGMSGFMMAHLGHTSMIHAVPWVPLLLWTLEKLRHQSNLGWFAVGILSVVCGIMAGHFQMFIYGLGLSLAYVVICGWSMGMNRWKYYFQYLAMIGIGILLSAVQLLPAYELFNLGMRTQMSFESFNECSLAPYQTILLLFPYLLGGTLGSPFPSYFGPYNIHELSGYIGLFPILLAGVGVMAYFKRPMIWFWLIAGLITFLLTLGDSTPLAKIMYYLSGYNKFRSPARHFMEMSLAVSVLAGFGVTSILNQKKDRRFILKLILIGASIMLMGLAAISIFSYKLQALAIKSGIERLSLLPWSNLAIGLPLVLFTMISIVFLYWTKNPTRIFYQVLFLSILIIDLSSFGWLMQWRYRSPGKDVFIIPPTVEKYRQVLHITHQRLLPIRGSNGDLPEIPPNISRLWKIPSASGYGPLLLLRLRELLIIQPAGFLSGLWASEFDRSLDIMGIRYITLPQQDAQTPSLLKNQGFFWVPSDLPIQMGGGCNAPHSDLFQFDLPTPFSATTIGVVSALACSDNVPNNAEVINIKVTDRYGNVQVQKILAGRDTSEWAYDCCGLNIKHQRASIFKSFPYDANSSQQCEGHHYLGIIYLGKKVEIKNLEFQWVGPSGMVGIKKLSLLNEETGESLPVFSVNHSLKDPKRWRHLENVGEIGIYENLRAMPRAWLVPEVVSLKPEEILYVINSSQLPDGRTFDPSKIALVEEPFTFKSNHVDEFASAQVIHMNDTTFEIHTNDESPSFLVLSDIYYPGWKATIDGNPTHIFQTNYVLRGVMIPQGGHVIRFEFKPKSFYLGIMISAISMLFLIGVSFFFYRKGKQAYR